MPERRAELLLTLGDLQREHLDAPDDAVLSYEAALVAVPGEPRVLAGLRVLLSEPRAAAVAIDVLLASHRAADSWSSVLELTPDRLRVAKDDAVRIAVLLEVAELQERRAGDLAAAFQSVRDAFVLALGDVRIEGELARLAELAGAWRAYADAHRQVLDVLEARSDADPGTVARLRLDLADALENRLDDPRGALALLLRVAELAPEDEVAGDLGRPRGGADRAVGRRRTRGPRSRRGRTFLDEGLLSTLGEQRRRTGRMGRAHRRLRSGPGRRGRSSSQASRAISRRVSPPGIAIGAPTPTPPRSRTRGRSRTIPRTPSCSARSRTSSGATAAARSSTACSASRRRPAAIPSCCARPPRSPPASSSIAGSPRASSSACSSSLPSGGRGPRTSAPMTLGSPSHPSEHVEWALAELVRVHNEEGNAERIVELLAETAKLPFERRARARAPPRGRARRPGAPRGHETALSASTARSSTTTRTTLAADAARRGARRARPQGGAPEPAQAPGRPSRPIARCASPLASTPRASSASSATSTRRSTALRENLRDAPRHPASTLVLSETLEDAGRCAELVTFLAEQAELAERDTDALSAVELWARAAELAEEKLDNLVRRAGLLQARAPARGAPGGPRRHRAPPRATRGVERRGRAPRSTGARVPGAASRASCSASPTTWSAPAREADARARLEAALDDPSSPEELQGRLAELYRSAQLHRAARRALDASSIAERRSGDQAHRARRGGRDLPRPVRRAGPRGRAPAHRPPRSRPTTAR